MLGELKFDFSRTEIMERVKENRDKHAEEFAVALKGYYLEVQEQLEKIAEEAQKASVKAGKEKDPKSLTYSVNARKPEDHTGDYDRILDMLRLAKNENIELDEQEFAQYVRDEWAWKQRFTETSSTYLSKFGTRISG
jgi:hypothetical protein